MSAQNNWTVGNHPDHHDTQKKFNATHLDVTHGHYGGQAASRPAVVQHGAQARNGIMNTSLSSLSLGGPGAGAPPGTPKNGPDLGGADGSRAARAGLPALS
jgi:hypothetical protein